MNIYEAAKSGKPFKRPEHKFYSDQYRDKLQNNISLEDIQADDWELELQAASHYPVTKEELDELYCLGRRYGSVVNEEVFRDQVVNLVKKITSRPEI